MDYACSGYLLYLGVDKVYPEMRHQALCQMPPDSVPSIVGQAVPGMCGQTVPTLFSQCVPG